MYCFSASFCFLCLKHYPKKDLLDIHKKTINNTKIIDVLQSCGIDSNYCDDSYQVYICEECVKNIEPFYTFKQNCSANFTKLKGYVEQLKSNANVAFHANLKVVIPDPKNADTNETMEYVDLSEFVETQIQGVEMMDVQVKEPVIKVKTPAIVNNLQQLYQMGEFMYDRHFLNDVIEVASSPESFNDFPQNSSGSFNEAQSMLPQKHKCFICDKVYPNSVDLSLHTFLHTLVTYPNTEASQCMKYYCVLCTLDINGLTNIKTHLTKHTHDKIYKCEDDNCKRDFMSYIDFHEHMKIFPSHKQFSCDYCDKTFITAHKVKIHILKNHIITCMFCKQRLESKQKLKEHMRTRHNNIFCNICSTSYKSNNRLKKHLFDEHFELQSVGPEGNVQYNCMRCKNVFQTKYSLNEHLGLSGCNIIKL